MPFNGLVYSDFSDYNFINEGEGVIYQTNNSAIFILRGKNVTNFNLENHGKIQGLSENSEAFIFHNSSGKFTNTSLYNASFSLYDNSNFFINNSGEIKGKILNQNSTIQNLENSGNINEISNNNGTITILLNSGEITQINNKGEIKNLTNTGGIKNTINNEGILIIDNSKGYIQKGIINNGGTLNIDNHDETTNVKAKNFFGKTANGVHIENKGGRVNIKGWYFDDGDFKTNEARKNNSILVDGNLNDIKVDKIIVNVRDDEKVYDSNTFFADKDGNAVGDKVNNGENFVDKIANINDIYKLYKIDSGIGGCFSNGCYSATLQTNELSGKTLAKSIISSSRLRYINISNILRDINGKTFKTDFTQTTDMKKSKKGEAYGNDADLLSELDDIFVKHKNANENYLTFIMPYYNYSSVNLGEGLGRLKGNTSGLIGGSQRNLPNDKGIIGFYLGYEQANKDQNTQRLEFDDKTYYGGLAYYNIIARSGINEYFISASTRFDYTNTDIVKTYTNQITKINSDAKAYGYGAEVKLGANYFNTLDIAMFSPEIGLSYQGMSSKNFTLRHLGDLNEHYNATQVNFLDATMALKYQKPWSDKLRTTIIFGGLINLYNDAGGELRLKSGNDITQAINEEIKTSSWYAFTQLGFSYALKENIDLSLNYGATLGDENTYSHNVFLKLGIWW